ncbi:MAG TPA: DNA polymerase I [Deltaproteobacteria bacterium]|nr:DNA polymerase I [Deltaproteobacteria bacterium]
MTEKQTQPKLFLVDGSNYIYRAFYAIRQLSNSKGFPTNAIYGFTNMLIKLCSDYRPDYIAVVFDSKGPTFRHEAYENYKANRSAMPDELIPQIPYIKDVVRGFSMPVIEQEGVEADDIIGTIAKACSHTGVETVIVSGDKDLMQLVSDDVVVVDTMKDKMYDVEGVKERFGIEPARVVDVLGLAGDASDNIPGVPGVGEKTALKLLLEYGSMENVLEHADEVKNAKVRKSLKDYADQARLSRELATIKTDVAVVFSLDDFRLTEPDTDILKELFKEFEFSSLLQSLKIREADDEGRYTLIATEAQLDDMVERINCAQGFALDILLSTSDVIRSAIVGISIAPAPLEAWYIPFSHDYPEVLRQLSPTIVLDRLRPIFGDERVNKSGYDLKNAFIALSQQGITLRGISSDVMVAAYVLNPSRRSIGLEDLAREYLDRELPLQKELTGGGAKAISMNAVPVEDAVKYACRRADFICRIAPLLREEIERGELGELFRDIEMPLVEVLASMEEKGVLVDTKLLGDLSIQLAELAKMSEEKIYRLAGETFNINSPKQLQVILFDKLGLPRGKRTKEGYSTDVEVLTSLAKSYELPAEILAYRSLTKLKSTYVDALPLLVNPATGRIHTSYNQTVTATGRLSSSNPNLQNIPIRTTEGKRIRQAFAAPGGHVIVSADYSQIELRILAHLSDDEALIRAFQTGEDIHARTASDIFGVFPEMVNHDMRRQAKVINFGILYGMSPFGLARELDINQKLAKAYIDEYFKKYQGVRKFLDDILVRARKDGYVTTLMNRRRYLPEINSRNVTVRQFAERMAINTPIQGTAADLIKVAMLNIWRGLCQGQYGASMIMQVHDELVFEVPVGEKDRVMELVKREMEQVIALKVPLRVEIASGCNWDEAH